MAHEGDPACKGAKDTVIRLPRHLTASPLIEDDETLTGLLAHRVAPRAARGTQKNAQSFYNAQVLRCAVSTGFSNGRLVEGICKAFEALLRATNCEVTRNNGGCRSLFSVCLRQIPSYIAEEQCRINTEDPENGVDVASEIYTDLEAFRSAPDGGWESLKEVVRAHGLSLVKEAIQEGLIEFSLSCRILSLCLGLKAYDGAECVIEGMISGLNSRRLPLKQNTGQCPGFSHLLDKSASLHRPHATLLTDDASRVADALRFYVSQSGRFGFMYRQMAVMLESSVLSIYCISSEAMIECWNGVIRSITRQDEHAGSAALLLQVAISTSYKQEVQNARANLQVHDLRLRVWESVNARPILRSYKSGQSMGMAVESRPIRSGEAGARLDEKDDAVQSTISDILILLSAVNILRSPKSALGSPHSNLLIVTILRDMALEIRKALELAKVGFSADRNRSLAAEPLHLPLLSDGVVSVLSRKADVEISRSEITNLATLANLPLTKESVCNSGSFLCAIARFCDKANLGDGFCFVQVVVQNLVSIANSDSYDKPTRKFCSGIAHAAAFAFSEDTGQAKHLDWALNVENAIGRTNDDSPKVILDKTPARAVMRNKSGYKWEEGICEWIAKSPALTLPRPTATGDVDRDDTYGKARNLSIGQVLPLRSEVLQCNTKRRLRSKRRSEGHGSFGDVRENGDVKGKCGSFSSSQKLLFIRVSPRPQKMPRPQTLPTAGMANELDELSIPEVSRKNPGALLERPNPPSGVLEKLLGQKHKEPLIGNPESNGPPAKRRRLDTETFAEDTDDELGLP